MPEPWVPDPESEDLILRRFDERLTEAEFAAFDERLRSDAAFRQHYVRMADLNASNRMDLSYHHLELSRRHCGRDPRSDLAIRNSDRCRSRHNRSQQYSLAERCSIGC
jgi:hypothetical protein